MMEEKMSTAQIINTLYDLHSTKEDVETLPIGVIFRNTSAAIIWLLNRLGEKNEEIGSLSEKVNQLKAEIDELKQRNKYLNAECSRLFDLNIELIQSVAEIKEDLSKLQKLL